MPSVTGSGDVNNTHNSENRAFDCEGLTPEKNARVEEIYLNALEVLFGGAESQSKDEEGWPAISEESIPLSLASNFQGFSEPLTAALSEPAIVPQKEDFVTEHTEKAPKEVNLNAGIAPLTLFTGNPFTASEMEILAGAEAVPSGAGIERIPVSECLSDIRELCDVPQKVPDAYLREAPIAASRNHPLAPEQENTQEAQSTEKNAPAGFTKRFSGKRSREEGAAPSIQKRTKTWDSWADWAESVASCGGATPGEPEVTSSPSR